MRKEWTREGERVRVFEGGYNGQRGRAENTGVEREDDREEEERMGEQWWREREMKEKESVSGAAECHYDQ